MHCKTRAIPQGLLHKFVTLTDFSNLFFILQMTSSDLKADMHSVNDKQWPETQSSRLLQEGDLTSIFTYCHIAFIDKNFCIKCTSFYYFQTYGYQHFLTLQNLEGVGLLKVQDQRPYLVLRKALHLTDTALDMQVSH